LVALKDEEQILKLFEDGDHALVAADAAELSRIFSDDYVQYDESGKIFTRQDVIDSLKTGKIRYVSMVSTSRRIRLFGDFAIVHGTEVDMVEQAGERAEVRYVYMDVVERRNGGWQIVGSQLAKPPKEASPSEIT
jgi:ketosteroid isomerase-like protein